MQAESSVILVAMGLAAPFASAWPVSFRLPKSATVAALLTSDVAANTPGSTSSTYPEQKQ